MDVWPHGQFTIRCSLVSQPCSHALFFIHAYLAPCPALACLHLQLQVKKRKVRAPVASNGTAPIDPNELTEVRVGGCLYALNSQRCMRVCVGGGACSQ